MSESVSKSWFVVLDNPEDHGYSGTPQEIVDLMCEQWTQDNPTRTGAWIYCISAAGLKHVHMVVEDVKAMRFSAVKKVYHSAYLQATKGNKEQAEDYINKRGKYAEKGEEIIATARYGEIKGAQGIKRDLHVIEELIKMGMTANQILAMSFSYRRYEKMIRDACIARDFEKLPFVRDVNVVWHVGESGSGKSYTASKLVSEFGEDHVFFLTDYENGGLDTYMGQPVLFLDEFRSQWSFGKLLNMLDGYKQLVHSRYVNIPSLWREVHITSVKAPEMVYQSLVSEYQEQRIDTFEQLRRRISTVVYHWKDHDGVYHTYEMPGAEYKNYAQLVQCAFSCFVPVPVQMTIPFEESEVDE